MGYKLAGYNHIGGVEFTEHYARVYKQNHNPEHFYLEDIRDFNKREDLPSELFNLDLLDGSPPCAAFSTVLSSTISKLKGLSTLLSQQEAQLKELCCSLSVMCKVEGPLSAEQLAALDSAKALSRDNFSVAFVDATTFIRDQGTFVIDTLATIPSESVVAVTRSVANLFAGLYTGIMAVVTTRDSNN